MITKIQKIFNGYEFQGEADGPITKKTFEGFANDTINYMKESNMTHHFSIAAFHDYGTIRCLVIKLIN